MHTKTPLSIALRAAGVAMAVAFFGPGSSSYAAEVASEPVGVSSMALLSSSDARINVPFLRPAFFVGQVSSVSGNMLTVVGAPGWSSAQFVYVAGSQANTYFVILSSGALEGRTFTITNNGPANLSLDLDGGDLTDVRPGDALRIVPYWTLDTLFPASAAGMSFTPTVTVNSPMTTLALFVPASAGINGVAAATFFYYSGAWRQIGQSVSINKNDQIVGHVSPIALRNAPDGGAFVVAGAVAMQKLAVPLGTQVASQQDNVVGLCRPLPVTLNASGLTTNGAFDPSSSALARTDLLLVSDNAVSGMNKAASAIYFYYNSGWRKLGQPLASDFGSDVVFDASKSVTIRKGPSVDGARRYWINPAPY